MTITKKILAVLIIAGAASPLLAIDASAAPAGPCATQTCIGFIAYNPPPGQGEPIWQCTEWKTVMGNDCTTVGHPDIVPPDRLLQSTRPKGGPRPHH